MSETYGFLVTREFGAGELDERRVDRGLRTLAAMPIDRERLEVVLTGHIARSTRKRKRDWEYNLRHALRPVAGRISASVLPMDDNRVALLVDAGKLSARATKGADTDRIFRHEGWHVVLTQRGEHALAILDAVDAQGLPVSYLVNLAAELLEEYRADLPLVADDVQVSDGVEGFVEFLRNFERKLDEALTLELARRGEKWHQTIANSLSDFVQRIGRVAAEASRPGMTIDAVRATDVWAKLVERHWGPLRETLAAAKPASEAMTAREQTRLVVKLAGELKPWLEEDLRLAAHERKSGEDETRHVEFRSTAPP